MDNRIEIRSLYFDQALAWGRSMKSVAQTPAEIEYCKNKFKEFWSKYLAEKEKDIVVHKVLSSNVCSFCKVDHAGETVKGWIDFDDGINFKCHCDVTLRAKKGDYL